MFDGLDPRTPVLIGAGQLSQRVDRGAEVLEPVDLMVEALRRAEADSGGRGVLARADSVRVARLLSWRYGDPGALVGERIGASPRQTMYTVMGGNYVQSLVNLSAADIAAGRADVVLVGGAEAWRSRNQARAEGRQLPWTTQPDDTVPTVSLGEDTSLSSPFEVERGVFLPVTIYPMFEVALRAAAGRSPDEQRRRAAQLWADFSQVAATNPHAWIQQAFTADEIATPSPDNRMIAYPYTKLMNSNNNVEQGAGLILCSAEAARSMGVPTDRWVFPLAGTDAHDHWFVSNRIDLCSSPAIRLAGARAMELAGVGVDDLAHVDLYSCFPSAVQIAAAELGLGIDRPLTVTGGMSFAGGPWNNYPCHGIATMAGRPAPGPRRRRVVQRQRRLHHQARLRPVRHQPTGGRIPPRRPPVPGRRHPVASGGRRLPGSGPGRELHGDPRPRRPGRAGPVRAVDPGGRPHVGLGRGRGHPGRAGVHRVRGPPGATGRRRPGRATGLSAGGRPGPP